MNDHKSNNTNNNRELSEAVRELGKALELLKDMFDAGQKRYELLTHEIRKEREQDSRRQRRDAYIIAFLGIVGICVSVIVASVWDYEGKKAQLQQTLITKLYDQDNEIQSQINHQLSKRDQLMAAMTAVRSIRDLGQKECKNNKYAGPDYAEYKQKLFSASFALTSAAYQMKGVFSPEIQGKIEYFEHLEDVDRKDICDPSAVRDNDLRSLQTTINNLILEMVEKQRNQKEDILKQINK